MNNPFEALMGLFQASRYGQPQQTKPKGEWKQDSRGQWRWVTPPAEMPTFPPDGFGGDRAVPMPSSPPGGWPLEMLKRAGKAAPLLPIPDTWGADSGLLPHEIPPSWGVPPPPKYSKMPAKRQK